MMSAAGLAMPTALETFDPTFTITLGIANRLMRIEAVRQAIETLPINPRGLASLGVVNK